MHMMNDGGSHPMRRATDAADITQDNALVVITPSAARGTVTANVTRPDPTFVTHLIATAQQSPQTRLLRRAATADVEAAYRATASQRHIPMAAGTLAKRTA